MVEQSTRFIAGRERLRPTRAGAEGAGGPTGLAPGCERWQG